MNELENRIRRGLHAAGERIPESAHLAARPQPRTIPRRRIREPLIGIAAMVAVLSAVGVSFVMLSGVGTTAVTSGASNDGQSVATTPSVVTGTTFDGSSGPCSPVVTRDTLYLGGPAWEDNLAVHGFLLSLPAGPTATDLATAFVSRAIVGGGCELQITASTEADPGSAGSAVVVDVVPPATPVALQLIVDIATENGVIGVVAVRGVTAFDIVESGEDPVLHLQELPGKAAQVSVRFHKGDDVWELATTADQPDVPLVVPPTERDRFPDAQPDWVLFTVQDQNGSVLDAGGALIP